VHGLLEFIGSLGAPRIAAMVAVTIALVGFFAFLILRVTAQQMTPLFTELMDINDLLKLGPGTVLELDRKVGEAIDIYVTDRLVARGEVVQVEEKLGVTMTKIIKAERT
jgi:flagellar motor switch protein FliN